MRHQQPTVTAYLAHVRPLAPRAQAWRIGLAAVLVATGQALLTALLFGGVAALASALTGVPSLLAFDSLSTLDSPLAMVVTLLTFAGFTGGIVLAMRLLHEAPSSMLLGLDRRFDWRQFLRATFIFVTLGMAAFLVSLPFQAYRANLVPVEWAIWLFPAALAILVQVFAEEFVFRGYLQSQLAAKTSSPLVWGGVPTLLFGAMHLPTALAFGANFWLILAAPTLLGGLASHLTVRTGSIAAATGFHFANNVLGVLLVAIPGPFGHLSLFTYDFDITDIDTVRPMILINLGLILVTYAIFLFLTPPHTRSAIATAGADD